MTKCHIAILQRRQSISAVDVFASIACPPGWSCPVVWCWCVRQYRLPTGVALPCRMLLMCSRVSPAHRGGSALSCDVDVFASIACPPGWPCSVVWCWCVREYRLPTGVALPWRVMLMCSRVSPAHRGGPALSYAVDVFASIACPPGWPCPDVWCWCVREYRLPTGVALPCRVVLMSSRVSPAHRGGPALLYAVGVFASIACPPGWPCPVVCCWCVREYRLPTGVVLPCRVMLMCSQVSPAHQGGSALSCGVDVFASIACPPGWPCPVICCWCIREYRLPTGVALPCRMLLMCSRVSPALRGGPALSCDVDVFASIACPPGWPVVSCCFPLPPTPPFWSCNQLVDSLCHR